METSVIENKTRGEILAEKFAEMNYGDGLSHQEIEEIIQCTRKSNAYNTAIAKAKSILRDNHSRAIENLRGYGYRVVNPNVFTNYALTHYKRGAKAITTGNKYLDHAPVKDMSPEALDDYRRVHDRAITANAAVKGLMVEMKTLVRKPHPFATIVQ